MVVEVIIWGPDNYNALGVLRQLSPGGFNVLLLVNGKNHGCATASIYCKKCKFTRDYDEGLKYLLDCYTTSRYKPILIPTGDRVAEVIDQHQKELVTYFFLMGTREQGVLERVNDKNYMVQLARECGFLVPDSFSFTFKSSTEGLPIPCILKPTFGKGVKEFKTKIIWSYDKLKKFQKILNHDRIYILQKLIPKTHDILVYGCRMNDGHIVLAGQYIKDRWSDDGGGSHGLLTNKLPSYLRLNALKLMLERIDYKGLFSVEYGLCAGKAYFYEVNLRNDGTSHLFYQAGANLPLAWVYDCIGRKEPISTRITHEGININELYDIINVFKGRISLRRYRNDKKMATIFHYYSPEDKRPWKIAKWKSLWDLPFRAFLLKFRPYIIYIKTKFFV